MDRRLVPLVAAAVVAGALLRLWELGAHSLWLDELFTVRAVGRESWGGMLDELAQDVHPPLYYAAMRLWSGFAGMNDGLWRLPSALAGIGTIVATAVLGARASGPAAAVFGAWFVALSPMAVDLDREARGNAWLALFTTAAAAIAAGAADGRQSSPPSAARLVAFAACCALAVWTHVFGLFAVLALLCWFLVRYDLSSEQRLTWIGAGLGGVATLLLWAPVLAGQVRHFSEKPWYVEPSGDSLSWLWMELSGGQVGPAVLLLVLTVLGLARGSSRGSSLLLCGVVGLVLVPQLVSYLVAPVLRPRNIVSLLPMVCVVAGAGVGILPRSRLVALAGGVVAAAMALATTRVTHVVPVIEQWREAAALVAAERGPDDLLVANHPHLWKHYLPPETQVLDLFSQAPDAAPRAWLLLGHAPEDAARAPLEARSQVHAVGDLQGVWVFRLDQLQARLGPADFPSLDPGQKGDDGLHFYAAGGADSRPLRLSGRCAVGIRGWSDVAAGQPARVNVRLVQGDDERSVQTVELVDRDQWHWAEPGPIDHRPAIVQLAFLNDAIIGGATGEEDRNAHVAQVGVRCDAQ